MRKLTLKGFLAQYVRKLSRSDSLDLKKLAEEASSSNVRLRAPLVLYAVSFGREDLLQTYLQRPGGNPDMARELARLSGKDIERMLESGDAPDEYLKVWSSYLVARDAPARDEALKAEMRKKVLRLQQESGCSNYRIYTDLNLNPGNINSWLKNGDSAKVSYQTAERVMEYVLSSSRSEYAVQNAGSIRR
ncbi:MAG: transcriptional regulator [Oscillospiraceae bacterium]|nr:transcriptional regulator [Oscillospiraceae bacterium]